MFPIPLYVTTFKGDTTEIVKYFDSQEMNPAHGGGYGEISKNSYIIDNPICKPLTDFFMKCFRDFATNPARNSATRSSSFLRINLRIEHPTLDACIRI